MLKLGRYWPLKTVSKHGFSDLFAGFMQYASQTVPRTLNDKMEPPYHILEFLAVHSLPQSRWKDHCGSILVSNHLPKATTKSSHFGWSLMGGLTVFVFLSGIVLPVWKITLKLWKMSSTHLVFRILLSVNNHYLRHYRLNQTLVMVGAISFSRS